MLCDKHGWIFFFLLVCSKTFMEAFYHLKVKIIKVLLIHKDHTHLCCKANKLLQRKCCIIEYLDEYR